MLHEIINNAIKYLVPKTDYQYQSKLSNIIGDNRQKIQHMFMNTTHIIEEIEEIIEKMNKNKESIKKGITEIKDIVESNLFSIKIRANYIIVTQVIETAKYSFSKCQEVFDFLNHKSSSGKGKNKKQLNNSEKHYLSLKTMYNNIRIIDDFIEIIKLDFYKTLESIKYNHRKNNEIELLFDRKIIKEEDKTEDKTVKVPDISEDEINKNIYNLIEKENDYMITLSIKIMTQWFIKEKEKLYKLYTIVDSHYNSVIEEEYYDEDEYYNEEERNYEDNFM